jgi:hypothetical protein
VVEFERDHGCTEAEWLGWLPDAVHGHELQRPTPTRAVVRIAAGTLTLDWTVLPPRRIALLRLPRLAVRYVFADIDEAVRQRFMKRFDLNIQRGGG